MATDSLSSGALSACEWMMLNPGAIISATET
jgi:hypothetical protein